MASSLIRGRYVVSKVTGPASAVVIPDGAVAQRDGVILEVGGYDVLRARYPAEPVLGSSRHVVLPGLVNDHFHVGLSPFQLGAPDLPLELWSFARLGAREVDPYLDHLYGAMLMLESGTTTVQVLPTIMRHPIFDVDAAEPILRAYRDAGMRVSCGITLADQNPFVAGPRGGERELLAELPEDLARRFGAVAGSGRRPAAELVSAADEVLARFGAARDARVRVILAPSNVHRCSDRLLEEARRLATRHRTGIHIHLQETPYQKAFGLRQWGVTPLAHLHQLGFLGPDVTCAHGVWLTDGDIEILAATGAGICHNASSNLRIQSGIAPIGRLLQRGIPVALGSDEAGLNDDKDLFQEMRLVLKLHRVPGIESPVPTACQVLEMATVNGARAAGFGDLVGTLEPGKRADLMLLGLDHVEEPYLEGDVPILDALIHRGRGVDVDAVLIDGEPVLQDRRPTRFDRAKLAGELRRSLARPLRPREEERRELARALEPHLRRFYAGADGSTEPPHTRYNARC
jgi:cytosine/adenosine deaminase-related metal-dependent hydrolase